MPEYVRYTCEKCGFAPEVTNCDACDGIVVWTMRGQECTGCGVVLAWITCRQCQHRQGTPFEVRAAAAATPQGTTKRADASQDEESYERAATSGSATSDGEGSEFLGKLIGYAIVAAVALWLIIAVAIPLLLINLAGIFLFAGLKKREWKHVLLPLSILGMALLVADLSLGWSTKALVHNVSFFAALIPVFFYANLLAGLTAAYVLLRDFMDARSPFASGDGELSRRNLLTMGGLLVVGVVTVALQRHFGAADAPATFLQANRAVLAAPMVAVGSRSASSGMDGSASVVTTEGIPVGPSTNEAKPLESVAGVPSTIEVVAPSSMSAGYGTCIVARSGAASCWDREGGAFGTGATNANRGAPSVVGGSSFASVSMGYNFACWLTTEGAAYCAGANDDGQLGNDQPWTSKVSGNRDSRVPVAVLGGLRFSEVSAGHTHACGLTISGVAYCWGDGHYGQLGNGSENSAEVPTAVLGGLKFASISAGTGHTCGVTVGGAGYCWGDARSKQPVELPGGLRFAAMSASVYQDFTCGVTMTYAAYCWGTNDNLQLGHPNRARNDAPSAVAGGQRFASVSAGSLHACGITADGAAFCWGTGGYGLLGTGRTETESAVPTAVTGGVKFKSLSAGWMHTCGLSTTGAMYCWGASDYFARGGRYAEYEATPVMVPYP